MSVLSILFILGGIFFFATGVVGLLRFPDFFSRMHASGKGDTLGILLMLIGLSLYSLVDGFSLANILVSIKLMMIGVFWLLANPTATHAILRAAFDSGLMPWTKDGKPVLEWPPHEEGTNDLAA
jgi:multicomponent Na+:H+ antiporter subunit G